MITYESQDSKQATPNSSRSSTPTMGKGNHMSRPFPENNQLSRPFPESNQVPRSFPEKEDQILRSPRTVDVRPQNIYENNNSSSSARHEINQSPGRSDAYISRSPGRHDAHTSRSSDTHDSQMSRSPARSEGHLSRTVTKYDTPISRSPRPSSARSDDRLSSEYVRDREWNNNNGTGDMLPPRDRERSTGSKPSQKTVLNRNLDRNRTKSLPGQRISGLQKTSEKFVTFRAASPILSSTGSDNSDDEMYNSRHVSRREKPTRGSKYRSHSENTHTPLGDGNNEEDFSAVNPPRSLSARPTGYIDTERKQSSLYKANSQPELGHTQRGTSPHDTFRSSYKYTSLRDNLRKGTSPRRDGSSSQEDLRLFGDSDASHRYGNAKSFSVDIGLESLGLNRTSPRKFNPSPERLITSPSRDAGESPIGTPRGQGRTRSFMSPSYGNPSPRSSDNRSSGEWESDKKYFPYRYGNPVKSRVDMFQALTQ